MRQLRKSPGFTAVALITLALGIGMSTSIFTVIEAVLLRPLAFSAAGTSDDHLGKAQQRARE